MVSSKRKKWSTRKKLVVAGGAVLAVTAAAGAVAGISKPARLYRARGRPGWLERKDMAESDIQKRHSWQLRDQTYFAPFAKQHPQLGPAIHHGSTAAIFEGRGADVRTFLSFERLQPLDAWATKRPVPEQYIVKVSIAENILAPGWYGLLRNADSMSGNEIRAMRRLTRFRCQHAPELYACCRFKIDRGWLQAPAYLVVLVMEKVNGLLLSDIFESVEARKFMPGVADALKDLRLYGILHTDLHFGNVILGEDGVIVIDFGLAIVMDVEDWRDHAFLSGGQYDWLSYLIDLRKWGRLPIDPISLMNLAEGQRVSILRKYWVNADPIPWLQMRESFPLYADLALNNKTGNNARRRLLSSVKSHQQNYNNETIPLPSDVQISLASKLRANANKQSSSFVV